mmetsp:Transcript_25573/g.39321  ORF Transcript_25573/g.39321 Transcript_25573/m.39321 type:complete len:415 (-) Transcript_25573:1615-2859(-)
MLLAFAFACISCISTVNSLAAENLLPCPATRWPSASSPADIGVPVQRKDVFVRPILRSQQTIDCESNEVLWLQQNGPGLMELLDKHGALHFKNFQLPKSSKSGFRTFCEAFHPLLQPCEDSLASIGVRSLLSVSDGVYRAVDSESLSNTFIGLHNDATYKLAPPFAAFCCFQQATETGGEFLLADGREILRRVSSDPVASRLLEKSLRVRVAGLPTPFLQKLDQGDSRPSQGDTRLSSSFAMEYAKDVTSALVKQLVGWGLQTFIPLLQLELAWTSDRSMLQIMEPLKSPINCHPQSGIPTFFSGLHSQSAYLQGQRAASAFSGVAMTDVFYGGDLSSLSTRDKGPTIEDTIIEPIETEVLDRIEEIMHDHTVRILMDSGDVVLLDSYQVLYGRDIFQGTREHGVIWLTNDYYS